MRQRVFDDAPRAFHEAVFADVEAAGHDLKGRFHLAGRLVDGDDGQHDAVFAQVTAVFDDEVFDHVGAVARVDADAAYGYFAALAGAEFVEFQDVAALDQHDLAHRSAHG